MRHFALLTASLFGLLSCALPQPLPESQIRVATFNVAMGLDAPGELANRLQRGDDARLRQVAEILQRVRPDVVLLNEFDYDPSVDAADLLNDNYLAISQGGQAPIRYFHHFRAPVNAGVPSGLDLDGDGVVGGPADAWGYGAFPGQYGMLVLSRHPILHQRTRTFRTYPWSALARAESPKYPDGRAFYDASTWAQLRLSSKSHWDLTLEVGGKQVHLLASHPTPPVFDGPEDRNGMRNFDEIRFWREYTGSAGDRSFIDDEGGRGGIRLPAQFIIAGDLNADPLDGDARPGAVDQLLKAAWINPFCVPTSDGGRDAAIEQGGVNKGQRGNPAADTADFNDRNSGNLRLDYVLPSIGLRVLDCGVFWPEPGRDGAGLVEVSDHRLVWLDLVL